jgi:Uncharacterised protein family (UPF0158)
MLNFTQEQIKEIAEYLDTGFRAFYHKKTGELIFVPDMNKNIGMDEEAWEEELEKSEENFMDYQEMDAMQSSDSFKVMEDFAEQISDVKLKKQLINALEKRKPFREFKFVVDDSLERQNWFAFKEKCYMEWVEKQLERLSYSAE